MASPTWPKLPDLIEALLEDASQFSLDQAVRMVERLWPERGRLGSGLDCWLRLVPAAALSFPAADLRRCELDEQGRLVLQVNPLGLYGVDSPLPHYFLDATAADDERSECLRRFLDGFSHRLYALLYLAGRLERPALEEPDTPLAAALAAVAGVSEPDSAERTELASAFSRRTRSAAGLQALVRESLGGVPVRVRDRLPSWQPVPAQALGAQGPALGHDSLLGDRLWVAAGRVQVEIGPLPLAAAQRLLPSEPGGRALLARIRDYLQGKARFDLVLRAQPGAASGCRLGAASLRLGWSTWTGEQLPREYRIHVNGDGTEPCVVPATAAPLAQAA